LDAGAAKSAVIDTHVEEPEGEGREGGRGECKGGVELGGPRKQRHKIYGAEDLEKTQSTTPGAKLCFCFFLFPRKL
jgi:hypothetical protein